MMRLGMNKGFIGFCAGSLVCMVACLSLGLTDSVKEKNMRPVVSAMTLSPEIPAEITFCGEQIDLTRYDIHENYDRELSGFTYSHSTTMLLIKRANRYFPVIEPILKANGVPDDFKYLAVIESQLEPRAQSGAQAVGMWQLLEPTAKQFGLTVTATVDERCDVEKATVAVCKYVKAAYVKYQDWVAVAASYNGGMGRISGELSRQDADKMLDLWLNSETTRYVYRAMAVKQIFEAPYKYGFILKAQDLYKPIGCKEVTVSGNIDDLSAFAKQKGVTYADLRRFNPWMNDRKLITGGKTFTVKIPNETDMYYKKTNTYVHNSDWLAK